MDLTEIGWGGMEWIDLTLNSDLWRALVNTVWNSSVSAQKHIRQQTKQVESSHARVSV
jgi:hypothetical protein